MSAITAVPCDLCGIQKDVLLLYHFDDGTGADYELCKSCYSEVGPARDAPVDSHKLQLAKAAYIYYGFGGTFALRAELWERLTEFGRQMWVERYQRYQMAADRIEADK